jgi:hypothetical protein
LHRERNKDWPEPAGPPDPQVGTVGVVKLLDIWVGGITSPKLRHVIKRYLRRSGFRDLVLEHLPGEAFVEFQLAAKAARPDLFVAVSAYGDYAPWYIGTAVAYQQGGYETSPSSSNVGPEAEAILLGAIQELLQPPR